MNKDKVPPESKQDESKDKRGQHGSKTGIKETENKIKTLRLKYSQAQEGYQTRPSGIGRL